LISDGQDIELAKPGNIPELINHVVLSKLATLHELKTIYSINDLYDLYEILSVKSNNDFYLQKLNERKHGQ